MRTRFPLSAKILLWFFLNLLLLGGIFVVALRVQFSFDLDWILGSGGRERVEALREIAASDLGARPRDDWDSVLNRLARLYGVRFALFSEDGRQMAGEPVELPEDLCRRIWPRADQRVRSASDGEERMGSSRASSNPPFKGGRRGRFRGGGPPQTLVRTTQPTRYWLIVRTRLGSPGPGSGRVVLIAISNSLSGGGLFIDLRPWLWIAVGAVVFSILFWLPLVAGITRAIGQITNATRKIADGCFDVRVSTRRRDELGSLGEAINQMAARLDGFVQGQKRFLGDIAHELCSPLARLQMALGILEQRADTAEQKYVRSAVEKAEQISTLVGELLSFSKASFAESELQLKSVNVREAVAEALQRETVEGAKVNVEIPADLAVAVDEELLVRAVANLIRNAIRHAGGGPIVIRARTAGGEAIISVADSGPGAPEGEISKLFDAFYRVDSSRTRDTGGVGLGLTIVKRCVEACGGSVTARNVKPHGFEVVIRLAVAGAVTPGGGVPAIRT